MFQSEDYYNDLCAEIAGTYGWYDTKKKRVLGPGPYSVAQYARYVIGTRSDTIGGNRVYTTLS